MEFTPRVFAICTAKNSLLKQKFIKSLGIQNNPFTIFLSFYNIYLDKIYSRRRVKGSVIDEIQL